MGSQGYAGDSPTGLIESAAVSNGVQVIDEVAELSSLTTTNYITKSESAIKKFVSEMKSDGAIKESILYVENNRTRSIV